ncbi:MAG TPA: YcxB family protein [Jiangellaceae bacterium]
MAFEQVAVSPVELEYTLTSDDLRDGVGVQLRGIRRRWLVALLGLPPLVGIAIGLVRADSWDLPADAVPFLVIGCFVVMLVAVGFGLLAYRLLHRWFRRWQAHLIMRGNPWLSQPMRTTVADTGVHARNATGESRSSWSQYALYVETDQSFVLLASKRIGSIALVLPKRGLTGEDAGRLRALLDTHCQRYT